MKRPNITAGEWKIDRRFPASVIAGEAEETAHGLAVDCVCRVMGSALPNYKTNLQFIAAAPDMAKALEDCYAGLSALWAIYAHGAQNDTLDAARAALIKAGYEFP